MHKEVEIKILEVDIEQFSKYLESLGAKKVFDSSMKAIYLENSSNTLKDNNLTLRIREEGKSCKLTLKEKIGQGGSKIHIETEESVEDYEITKNIFLKLGYKSIIEQKKRRISYIFEQVRVDMDRYLDELSFIPEFIEIEGEDFETINRYIDRFNLRNKQIVNWNFFELKEYYENR